MNKVAIYVRLSDEDKDKINPMDESQSIQNQKSMLMEYAMQRGWEIYNIYSDEDYAGSDRKRPKFNELLQDAQKGKFDVILCKTQSRFTREMELVEKYLHNKFPEWGIRFISLVDHADTYDKANKKSRQINGLMNEWYLEDLSENIKTVLRHKKEQGQHCSRYPLYGYRKDPTDKNKLLVDEIAAQVVKEIFRRYLQGQGCNTIAHVLNDRGVSSPGKYKREQGVPYHNNSFGVTDGKWSSTTIYHILKNQNYTGDLVQGYTRKLSYKSGTRIKLPKDEWIIVPDVFEGLVSKEDFQRVQDTLAKKARVNATGERSLFVGKIFCADCRHAMSKNKTISGVYLRCRTSAKFRGLCTWHTIREDDLVAIVTDRLQGYFKEIGELSDAEMHLSRSGQTDLSIKSLQKEAAMIDRELQGFADTLSSLYMDKAAGGITLEQFAIISDNLSVSSTQKKKRKKAVLEEIGALQEKQEDGNYIKTIVEKYRDFKELNREILDTFVDRIEVYEKDSNKQQNVTIKWLF